MFFHVILTTKCNSQCRYCYGEAVDDVDGDFSDIEVEYCLPQKLDYDITVLQEFCKKDPDCALTFYGGEPLLCANTIREIIDKVKAKMFLVQTNGLLLNTLEPTYVNKFNTILVSIDGDEKLTDYYRGKGTYRKVVDNLRMIKRNGFSGELIARMTVMEQTDIQKQVKWLLSNHDFTFSSIHWQLNAGFWKNDFRRRDFVRWTLEDYDPGVQALARFWVDYMEENGAVLKLYPFLGVAKSLLSNDMKGALRCGGGWINYAIQTDGHIVPCPAMWGMKRYYLGHVSTADPLKLAKMQVKSPCTECDVLNICGGRCLYANVTRRWNLEDYKHVCDTVKNLIEAVNKQIPRIDKLIEENKIQNDDFEFLEYNGAEIIP